MNAIDWEDICFGYNGQIVLHPSSFSIPRGKLVGIMGPNGGGKTTLLKLLMGFLKPLKGSLHIFGKSPAENYPHIGYVPQFSRSDREFPITLEEVVDLGSRENGSKWIEKLNLGSHRKKRFGELSGGLAQRALLARALAADPTLLLLDEPTANIDPPSAVAILDLLDSLKGEMTILLVTHDVKTIIERVDQILSVQGKIHPYLPKEVCEHFAMGLYHTPLLDLPPTHWRGS
ncbi:MAG TPA: ATP-binding cassette domain-containing protein [Chlamydiales bacterium]|jgi:zinc transport system ATP-binding protein|nr:ATP-binding cassette domain-containing protein [Chlamydiales bacterium]